MTFVRLRPGGSIDGPSHRGGIPAVKPTCQRPRLRIDSCLARRAHRAAKRVLASALFVALVAGGVGMLQAGDGAAAFKVPAGLAELEYPKDNPYSAARVALGKQLFFDGRLSRDNKVACATCHDPAKGFSNGAQFATGVGGKQGGRNAPTVINAAYSLHQFWDGRARGLEEQALGPIQNPIEMNMTLPEVVEKVNKIDGYRKQFQALFGGPATAPTLAQAIAAYERTILSGNAPFDRFQAGDKQALSEAAQRGMKLFFGKAHCSACHAGPNFTDHGFHNIGIGMDRPTPDPGRYEISKLEGDRGGFKTPTLREIARSAPYMHDGSLKTLEEVVEHYLKGGVANPYLDEEVYEIKLAKDDIADLVQFLKEGLSSPDYPEHTPPKLPE
jgi:cytochrome c peroxidase